MRAILEALILIASPVPGLRPMRSFGLDLGEFGEAAEHDGVALGDGGAHDVSEARRTASTALGSASLWTATAAMSSRRFMDISFWCGRVDPVWPPVAAGWGPAAHHGIAPG
jgi:hypothetical protein